MVTRPDEGAEVGWPLVVFKPNATSVDAGFFTWEIETGEVICEPVTYRLHGLREDRSATMDTFLSRVPETDLPGVISAMKRMMASCDTYQIEYRVKGRSEEHTSELQSRRDLVCRLLLEKKK